MSWVKAAALSADDVFDENGDELNLQSREWASNMKRRIKDGYVDGADAGEEASLPEGFVLGYREGAAQTVAVGRLRGIVSAILCWCQIQHPEAPVPASVTDLLQQATQHENQILDRIKNELENPPPSVSTVSESMEDLEMGQADPGCCGEGCKESNCCKAEKMDMDVHQQPQNLCSGASDCSSSSSESLSVLLQRCVDLVTELGLPQEMISHIQELNNM
ncbi:OTU deubiquitinase with linear linkage specificity a [Mugil cephalus]|uniref:OTU deubiquitinase with linear linkage specificity a n=1 Tax=Mugil cephalus TaxID=48193 RepID=UPI001FB6ED4B|nr:OTU deubiquitinase with linear linkage specificity a [Mugil cephalus]